MMWKVKREKVFVYKREKILLLSGVQPEQLFDYLNSSFYGLNGEEVVNRQEKYGLNDIAHQSHLSPIVLFIKAFINPFIGILTVLALVSLILDVVMAPPEDREWSGVVIITLMVFLSVIMRFWQERKSGEATSALLRMVKNTCAVKRDGKIEEIDNRQLVPGDIVHLTAGDMIPADLRILKSKDFFVSQSSLTGESVPIEKKDYIPENSLERGSVVELDNICFMGSTVISGAADGIVIATGFHSYLGTIAKSISEIRVDTAFDKGISKVSFLLIRFMLVMVPFVFFINGFTKGDWFDAFVFAISVAVGLTPEMLPMIVTANLSRGALRMAKKKTIVKNLNAIQNFGAMDILCTDKTGTLTCDNIVLEKYINADGSSDTNKRILRHAYFNSYFQTGLRNLMDKAVLSHVKDLHLEHLTDEYRKVDEIPFDFMRRRMSVVVEDNKGKRQIITKGAVEEMMSVCSYTEVGGNVIPITAELRIRSREVSERLNKSGMRVLAVAQKTVVDKERDFKVSDETEMVLIGFLAFLDPPKPSASEAIEALHDNGVQVKILSGDNDEIVRTIGRQVGLDTEFSMTGLTLESLSDDQLRKLLPYYTLFSKLTPLQKTRIIRILQESGRTVGFLGDGINDASALRQADIGISVDSAVDIAKENADIILLDKDLMVLEEGVLEGRKTFGNISKYIKMTASSNFGNMLSVMVSSAFLPFLPMLPVHLLIQNLLYDISQTAIPFDRMDKEYLQKPRKWDASDLMRFMLIIGPISSLFDIITYMVLWFVFSYDSSDTQALFQSGWFVEGLLSQTLIVHMIRTRKIPFLQSSASFPVIAMTLTVIGIGLIIPVSPLGGSIGIEKLPVSYYSWLAVILLGYCTLTQLIKSWYVRFFGRWL